MYLPVHAVKDIKKKKRQNDFSLIYLKICIYATTICTCTQCVCRLCWHLKQQSNVTTMLRSKKKKRSFFNLNVVLNRSTWLNENNEFDETERKHEQQNSYTNWKIKKINRSGFALHISIVNNKKKNIILSSFSSCAWILSDFRQLSKTWKCERHYEANRDKAKC